MYICSKSYTFLYNHIHTYAFFYYSIITFVCPTLYLPVKEMNLFDCVSHFVCLPLFVWPFIFTQKSDCEMVNLVFPVISKTILPKLLLKIWGYHFCGVSVFFSFCLYLWDICISHHNGISHAPHFRGAWSSSRCGELVHGEGSLQNSDFKGVPIFRGGSKDTFPREDLKLKGAS